jgi:N-acetylneuraminate synthase
LEHIAGFGKPIILSTGMNNLDSVKTSAAAILAKGAPLALLHCTSMYPTPYENVRLGAISQLANTFPDLPIGLSDHSLNIWTCLGAVALGASILEKHFTVTRDWPGPDIGISIEPDELHDLIEGSSAIWSARGGAKTILADEQPVIDFAYASVVTISAVSKGDEFTLDNTWVKRPGTGKIAAADLPLVLGKKANRDIEPEQALKRDDVAGL